MLQWPQASSKSPDETATDLAKTSEGALTQQIAQRMLAVTQEHTPMLSEQATSQHSEPIMFENQAESKLGITDMLLQNYGEAMNATSSHNDESSR